MALEVWAQESDIKGTRLVRFKRLEDGSLRWLGPVGEPDVSAGQFRYKQSELEMSGWEFVEYGDGRPVSWHRT